MPKRRSLRLCRIKNTVSVGDIQNNISTPDKELNILMNGLCIAFLFHRMQELRTFKNSPVFWSTL